MQAAIATSGQLVSDARWYAMGAFAPKPADFDEDAALAVLGMEDGAALLDRLCDLGLVENAGERYSLHLTVADYARMQLEERVTTADGSFDKLGTGSQPTTTAERHARYYLDLANEDRKDWRRIEAAWEQIQHAWRWVSVRKDAELVLEYVLALRDYQRMRGLWRIDLGWMERGLEATRTLGRREDAGTVLNELALTHTNLGNPRQALALYEQS